MRQRSSFRVFVVHAERTFLGASLALCASLYEQIRVGHVAGPRMDSFSLRGKLGALNGLQCCTCSIVGRPRGGHGLPHAPRGIDPCPPGFIRKADEVRVRKAVLQFRQRWPLAVFQVEDRIIQHRRLHAGCQNHQVCLNLHRFTQRSVPSLIVTFAVSVFTKTTPSF